MVTRSMRSLSLAWRLGLLACVVVNGLLSADGRAEARELTWDDTEKTYFGKAGETEATFLFTVKNETDSEVIVHRIEPSCGCTTVEMPATPWILAPGASRP